MGDDVVSELRTKLLDAGLALPLRFRVLFSLRGVGGPAAVDALGEALCCDASALLRHEAAFALGQMRARGAITTLKRVLADAQEHGMVRHECAEALGAIGGEDVKAALAAHAADANAPEVAETCALALRRLELIEECERSHGGGAPHPAAAGTKGSSKEQLSAAVAAANGADATAAAEGSPYLSVDPVPAAPAGTPTEELRATLLDEAAPMCARYGAMFALRDRGDREAAETLAAVLATTGSALLKHEIAYVLGQLQDGGDAVLQQLEKTLRDASEHPMVRHEAAEALGSIAAPTIVELLHEFKRDPDQIVSESCHVALDLYEHETSGELQYAFIPEAAAA